MFTSKRLITSMLMLNTSSPEDQQCETFELWVFILFYYFFFVLEIDKC